MNQAKQSTADVVVASVATLGRKHSPRLSQYDPTLYKSIIIDEAHHVAAQSYRRILTHFQATQSGHGPFVWGCSATLRRHDGLALDGVFDDIVFHKDMLDMIQEGWLSPLRVTTLRTHHTMPQHIASRLGDFAVQSLSKAVNTPERNALVVETWKHHALHRTSTLVFAADVAHVHGLLDAFHQHHVDAVCITGKTESADRLERITAFRERRVPVLINCGILTEGTDIPVIDCVVLARPTKSAGLLQQMIGRGMRKADGKQNCLVLDYVDNLMAERGGVCTVPALFGLEPSAQVHDADALHLAREAEKQEKEKMARKELDQQLYNDMIRSLKVSEYEDPFSLLQGQDGQHLNIRRVSRHNWLRIGPDTYFLSLPVGSLRITRDLNSASDILNYVVYRKYPTKKNIHATYAALLPNIHGRYLADVIRMCDAYVKREFGHLPSVLEWNAPWRKAPASSAQIELLRRRSILSDKELQYITKGRATDLLAKSFEGAFSKIPLNIANEGTHSIAR